MNKMVTRKGAAGLLLAVIMMAALLTGVFTPTKNALAVEDYRTWRQADERWANYPLGMYNMASVGCYVTSIAMVAAASGAKDTTEFNPGVFNQSLNAIGAFNQWGGLARWSSVNAVIPEVAINSAEISFSGTTREEKTAEMLDKLRQGLYVICNVGTHWVYIDRIVDGIVYMADPAKEETDMFSAYNEYSINRYQTLTGKNPYGWQYSYIDFNKEYNDMMMPSVGIAMPETTVTSTETTTSETTTTTTTTTTSETTTTTTTTTYTTTTTTTTTTTSTTSTTLTTTSVITATQPVTAETEVQFGEYYYSGEVEEVMFFDMINREFIPVTFSKGDVAVISEVVGDYGFISAGDVVGWVDMANMVFTGNDGEHMTGDVNGDGIINAVDLNLVNRLIEADETYIDGISVLTSCERKAADINSDGIVDQNDVLVYLLIIC